MLATLGPLPRGPEWVYEVKWDGIRLLADVRDGRLRLAGRSGREVTDTFPELAGLPSLAPDVLLDGEVVMLSDGVPSLAALADRMHRPVSLARALGRPAVFMVFDVLRLYGVPLLDRPLQERRSTLERLGLDAISAVSLSPLYPDGDALLAATAQRGMAGVVAKLRDAPYRPGRRSPSWVAITHRHSQSCLVGGWRPDRADPARLGALLVGVPEPGGGLGYCGRVGSGLDCDDVQRVLREQLTGLVAGAPPFVGPVPRVDAAGARWCKPALVVEVTHLGWTDGGRLSRPVFRGIRPDLDPSDVTRER